MSWSARELGNEDCSSAIMVAPSLVPRHTGPGTRLGGTISYEIIPGFQFIFLQSCVKMFTIQGYSFIPCKLGVHAVGGPNRVMSMRL